MALRERRGAGYASEAADALVRDHASLVRRIASQVASRLPSSIELDDLVQEGMIGLIDAARRWDPQGGAPFAVYARSRIRGAIYDWLRRQDVVSRHQRDKLRRVRDAMQELANRLGRLPEDAEIAAAIEMPIEEYHRLMEESVSLTVLDAIPEDDEPEAGRGSDPFENVALRQFATALQRLLPRLPEKERLVLALHYQRHLSFREVAVAMDLTPGRISQLHTQAMLRLRGWLGGSGPA